MDSSIRIVVADDHPISLAGLRATIASAPDIKVGGEATDGETAWALVHSVCPDIALLDIRLPLLDGLAVARRIRDAGLSVRFLFLSMWLDEAIVEEAMALGCAGYLPKECAAEEIVDAIRVIAAGGSHVSPTVRGILAGRHDRLQALDDAVPGLVSLTPTERRVLLLIAENRSTRQIADTLGISPRTVDCHRAHITAKLGLRGSHSLLRFAIEHRRGL